MKDPLEKYPTLATWTREFIINHPKYKKDSIVSTDIASDLVVAMDEISKGAKTYSDFRIHSNIVQENSEQCFNTKATAITVL